MKVRKTTARKFNAGTENTYKMTMVGFGSNYYMANSIEDVVENTNNVIADAKNEGIEVGRAYVENSKNKIVWDSEKAMGKEQVEQKARLVEETDSDGDAIYVVRCNETNEQLAFFRTEERAEEYLRCKNEGEGFLAKGLADANEQKKRELEEEDILPQAITALRNNVYANGEHIVRSIAMVDKYRFSITYDETHQYKAGQKHLRRNIRKTYISSRWYRVRVERGEAMETFIKFKVKIEGLEHDAGFEKALDYLEWHWKRADV